MNLALALVLCGALPAQPPADDNLDFHTGTLAGWDGEGFTIAPATGRGPSLACGVTSCDRGKPGATGFLHRTLVVPGTGGVLRCSAAALRRKGCDADNSLDVVLFAAGKLIIPKRVRVAYGWQEVRRLLPPDQGRPREYLWDLNPYAGQTLRIALIDEDKRPGCHLFCSGFRLHAADEFESRDFAQLMVRITNEQRLPPVTRFDTKHFLALSNADDRFSRTRLNNCELIYDLFFDHFRRKGFRLREPATKLMVAIFDSQAGFSAYVGEPMPASVTGLYHPRTNRLLVYDFGQNEAFVAQKRQAELNSRRIASDLDRMREVETVHRQAQEYRTGTNIATIMHEVAHQLSFNSGMLNRDGDAGLWLAEGLACYCEATDNGAWQGIGEMNPERVNGLALAARTNVPAIPLRDLVTSDDWLHGKDATRTGLQGYAQSWALFRMLMEERPQALRSYLTLIYNRKSPEHRLADFVQAFGPDLGRLQLRYNEYMKEVVERNYHPKKER
jgi:hypothetical protein